MSTLSFGREPGGRARISESGMQKLGNRPIVIECVPCRQSALLRHLWCTSGGGLKDFAPYRAAAASLPAKITARQPQSRQFLKSTFRDRDVLYLCRSESSGSCQLRRCRNHVPAENVCNTEARRRPYEDHHQLARSHAAAGRHHSRHRPNWLQRLPATPHKPAVHLRGRNASRRLRALTARPLRPIRGRFAPSYYAPPKTSPSCAGRLQLRRPEEEARSAVTRMAAGSSETQY
jgi:hypothetical protein